MSIPFHVSPISCPSVPFHARPISCWSHFMSVCPNSCQRGPFHVCPISCPSHFMSWRPSHVCPISCPSHFMSEGAISCLFHFMPVPFHVEAISYIFFRFCVSLTLSTKLVFLKFRFFFVSRSHLDKAMNPLA